ncbi:MAG: hypothetical protein ABF289_09265 [Clostridiales bacterium]
MFIFFIIYKVFDLFLKFIIYSSIGSLRIFFSTTKQQKFTLLLLLAILWIDVYLIYPTTRASFIHLIILILPFAYIINLGRGESA